MSVCLRYQNNTLWRKASEDMLIITIQTHPDHSAVYQIIMGEATWSLPFESNSIRPGGPAHGIVTKTTRGGGGVSTDTAIIENRGVALEYYYYKVATHFGAIPLFSMRAVSLEALQHCRSVDADVWCKRDLRSLVPHSPDWANASIQFTW